MHRNRGEELSKFNPLKAQKEAEPFVSMKFWTIKWLHTLLASLPVAFEVCMNEGKGYFV
ncbi:hypothetical protein HanPSC8_Chr15g0655431 [Helianthus annuus]|nr:hypothetical protein HanPSC8_Chr15g0655431 [Helianthus annuus]